MVPALNKNDRNAPALLEKIRVWQPDVPGGPVVYSAIVCGPGAKEELAARLLGRLDQETLERTGSLRLAAGRLGRPLLLLDGRRGPRLSFSHGGGLTWAALGRTRGVGIDLAFDEDFSGDYPFGRVFSVGEMRRARDLCPDRQRRAALLWSLKEAAVKALGTGFHTVAPRQVRCSAPIPWGDGWRFQLSAPMGLRAWARPQGPGWLALAAL